MKTYRIKQRFAPILTDVKGLHITPTECCYHVNVHVFDKQFLRQFNWRNRPTHLPKNCDTKLIEAILKKIQWGGITSEQQVNILREYILLAEKKDKHDKIKSTVKKAIKQVFLGLLLMIAGGVGGFALILLLMSIPPAAAGWIIFLIIPIAAFIACGIVKTGVGCLKLGLGIFLLYFRSQKNIEQLPTLENILHCFCFQSSSPPTYHEVMRNNTTYPSAPGLYSEEPPPSYQQAMDITTLSDAVTSSAPIALAFPGNSTHFFHHLPPAASSPVNDNPSSVCRYYP